jgi:transcriptional regulator with XRE-family HTH domain
MNATPLARLVRERIDRVYGENQAAFARAVGMSPQSVSALLKGKVSLPQVDARRRLARELRIPHLDLLILAGEIDAEEVVAVGREGVIDDPAFEEELLPLLRKIDWTDDRAVVVTKHALEFVIDDQANRRRRNDEA